MAGGVNSGRFSSDLFVLVVLGLLLLMSSLALADEKSATAAKTTDKPVIDGRLDDTAWEGATAITDFHQLRPIEYAAASEQTQIRVLYDEENLYISINMLDETPAGIVSQVTRQGAGIGSDDNVTIFIDGYNRRQSGFVFGVNLNGVRNEGLVNPDGSFNLDWRGIWHARAARHEGGWSAELEIPFRTLSFDPTISTWSFNAYRYIARKDELIAWVSSNQSQDAASSGPLHGFAGLSVGRGLDVVPALTLRSTRNFAPASDDQRAEPSLDLFYKTQRGTNYALTVNTDFSATEVDDRQVGLTQFDLFFPERRDFFLRDANIFEFGGIGANFNYAGVGGSERQNARPFFSRRIGLSATGAPVDLTAGAKASGKHGPLAFGVLAARQDAFEQTDADTLMVGRVMLDVLEESSVGLIGTYGSPGSNSDNSLVGMDFRYRNSRLGPGRRLEIDGWYQQSDSDDLTGDTDALGLTIAIPNATGWRGLAQYQRVGDNFNPAMGFVSRSGVRYERAALGYNWQFADAKRLQSLHFGGNARRWSYLDDGSEQSSVAVASLDLTSARGDTLFLRVLRFGEQIRAGQSQPFAGIGIVLPEQVHHWNRAGFRLNLAGTRRVSGSLAYFDGGYYTGDREVINASVSWRPNRHWRIQGSLNYWDVELPEGDFIVRLASTRLEWAPSSTLAWVNVIQYDNISGQLGFNSRLHWTPRAGQDAYFVVGHTSLEDDANDRFNSLVSDIAIKMSYTFRF